MTETVRRYGRLRRAFDPRVPHWSALKMGAAPSAAPTSVDYAAGLPADLGMMLNDTIGDCAEAGYCHALQVWSEAAGRALLTEPDASVEALYETQGYVPGEPSTDRGTVLQSLLSYLVRTASPAGGVPRLLSFVEVDPTNRADVDRATYESGLVYVGFNVPAYLSSLEAPGSVWDVDAGADGSIVGGHCVVSPGYYPGGRRIVSWGSASYRMTDAFWSEYVDECYALVSPEFAGATGLTPLGMTLAELVSQVRPLAEAA